MTSVPPIRGVADTGVHPSTAPLSAPARHRRIDVRARRPLVIGITQERYRMLDRRQAPTYDVCIVGSGAGGGMAAYALTRAGARVVMLEAGPAWYGSKNGTMLTPAFAT